MIVITRDIINSMVAIQFSDAFVEFLKAKRDQLLPLIKDDKAVSIKIDASFGAVAVEQDYVEGEPIDWVQIKNKEDFEWYLGVGYVEIDHDGNVTVTHELNDFVYVAEITL